MTTRSGVKWTSGVMVVALAVLCGTTAWAGEPYRSTGPEVAVGGLTPDEYFAQQAALHNWLMTQFPKGADSAIVKVQLNERDKVDLATPYVADGEPTPMRVGVVKAVSGRVGVIRGDSIGVTGKNATSVRRDTTDGGFVWATTVNSPGAVAIRVHFENFSLPPTAELYFFTREGEAYGPYVDNGPDGTGEFWSKSVSSATGIVLLRYFDKPVANDLRQLSFRITDVAHVAKDFPKPVAEGSVASFCQYNAACIENNSCTSDPAVNTAENAVAKMRWISGAFVNICTGGLMADTDPSTQIPYFLTANHCINKGKDAKNLEAYFQYSVSCGTSTCAGSFNPAPGAPSTFGANVVATGSNGDFSLLELKEAPPAGSTYLGWNNSPIAFSSGAALHRISHPSGAPQAYSEHAVNTSIGTCTGASRGPWIYSDDVVGATEGGSSGSPVVNAAGEVVGQLTGCCPVGGGNCNDDCNSNNHTIDGALAYYWNSVAPYLDPSPCVPSSEVCDNGSDDDCDGATDCADSDCSSDPACQGGCSLGQRGDPCSSGADCCSANCKRNGTCR